MKKSLVAVAAVLCGIHLAADAVELGTQEQRLGYTLGIQVGQNLQKQGMTVDPQAFAAALEDLRKGAALQMSSDEMAQAMATARGNIEAERKAKAEAALAAGRKFLEANRSNPGVITLPSGLQYQVLKEGSGDTPPPNGQVTVHYEGKLVNGTVFDSSIARGQPATFPLNGVIPGFSEALGQMRPGSKWRVFIPAELGYGEKGAGGAIGPNETLIFEIELISATS